MSHEVGLEAAPSVKDVEADGQYHLRALPLNFPFNGGSSLGWSREYRRR